MSLLPSKQVPQIGTFSNLPVLSKTLTSGEFSFTYVVRYDPTTDTVAEIVTVESYYPGVRTHINLDEAYCASIKKLDWKDIYDAYQCQIEFERTLTEMDDRFQFNWSDMEEPVTANA